VLWFAFALALALVDFIPAVLALPLLLVTTAVLDVTVLPLRFLGKLAFVSMTLFLLVVVFVTLVLVLALLLSPSHPISKLAAASKHKEANVRRIDPPSLPDRDENWKKCGEVWLTELGRTFFHGYSPCSPAKSHREYGIEGWPCVGASRQ
jgi:hypothetical protein